MSVRKACSRRRGSGPVAVTTKPGRTNSLKGHDPLNVMKGKHSNVDLIQIYHSLPGSNQFIQNGYRNFCFSVKGCLKSIFTLHNETLNIWTHLLGCCVFGALLLNVLGTLMPNISPWKMSFSDWNGSLAKQIEGLLPYLTLAGTAAQRTMDNLEETLGIDISYASDKLVDVASQIQSKLSVPSHSVETHSNYSVPRWPLAISISSTVMCFLCSTIFHTFMCHSVETYRMLQKMDWATIALSLTVSTISFNYYGFYCSDWIRFMYNTLSLLGTLVMLYFGATTHSGVTKGIIYVLVGCSATLLPVVHFSFSSGNFEFIWFYLLMGIFVITGLVLYSIQFPERMFPGVFDICGQSHQIHHVTSIVGSYFLYVGMMDLYEWRVLNICQS
eukprot:490516_1